MSELYKHWPLQFYQELKTRSPPCYYHIDEHKIISEAESLKFSDRPFRRSEKYFLVGFHSTIGDVYASLAKKQAPVIPDSLKSRLINPPLDTTVAPKEEVKVEVPVAKEEIPVVKEEVPKVESTVETIAPKGGTEEGEAKSISFTNEEPKCDCKKQLEELSASKKQLKDKEWLIEDLEEQISSHKKRLGEKESLLEEIRSDMKTLAELKIKSSARHLLVVFKGEYYLIPAASLIPKQILMIYQAHCEGKPLSEEILKKEYKIDVKELSQYDQIQVFVIQQ